MQNIFSIRKWLGIVCLTCIYFACNIIGLKKDEYQVEAILQEKVTAKAYLELVHNNLPKLNVDIVEGKLNVKDKIEQTQLALLYIIDPKTEVRTEYIFFIEPQSSIKITIDSLATKNYTVTGSKANDEFFAFKKEYIEPIEKQEKVVFQSINPDQINDQQTMEKLLQQSDQFQQQKKQAILSYLKKTPQSIPVTAYAFWKFESSNDFQFIKNIYSTIDKNTQQSFYGKAIENILNNEGDIDVGGVIKNFVAFEMNGKQIELAEEFKKNKLLLLEFWSSRCVPCRKENPNLVNLYQQYHSKGFDIIAISVDDDEQNWKKAIEQDQLAWTQICDFESWNGPIPKRYQVTETPTNFLINAQGKIVAKNIKGEMLKQSLQKAFN